MSQPNSRRTADEGRIACAFWPVRSKSYANLVKWNATVMCPSSATKKSDLSVPEMRSKVTRVQWREPRSKPLNSQWQLFRHIWSAGECISYRFFISPWRQRRSVSIYCSSISLRRSAFVNLLQITPKLEYVYDLLDDDILAHTYFIYSPLTEIFTIKHSKYS